jgi:CO/xanthine dehydrogenase Mo-binding subunit
MAWHQAAEEGNFEVFMKLWNWTSELQLKPEELRNEVLLSKDKYKETAWHKASGRGHVEILVKLSNWAKELELKPEELTNEVALSKDEFNVHRTAFKFSFRAERPVYFK